MRHVGLTERGLRADGARQGIAREYRRWTTRAQKRTHSHHHGARPRLRLVSHRQHTYRDHLLLAGHWTLRGERHRAPRPAGDSRLRPLPERRVRAREPSYGRRLCEGRSARELRMSESNALDAYQDAAARTINPALTEAERLLDAVAGLAEEAGEALGHVRKHVMQGRAPDRDALAREVRDALWSAGIVAR